MEKRLHYYNKERDRWISENGFFVTDPILIEIEQMSYNPLWKIKFLFFISKLLNIKICKCPNYGFKNQNFLNF